MELGKTFYARNRAQWRAWLERNHAKAADIWLIFYKKAAGKPGVSYDEAVEEALCFGWIDSLIKKVDDDRRAQRFSPRRPKSNLSETNKERIRRLIDAGKMTEAGLETVRDKLDAEFVIPPDILEALKGDKVVWKNFKAFPESYRRIRIGCIEGARSRPDIFKTRLDYLIKMTKQSKTFGMVK